MRRSSKLGLGAALALGSLLAVGASALRWDPEGLGPDRPAHGARLRSDEFRVVTLNGFKLSEAWRIDPLVDALGELSHALASENPGAPEVVAVQELESRPAVAALRARLTSHELIACECALADDGSLRSAVALAVRRDAFTVLERGCVPLGRVWPDHPRCAVEASLSHSGGGRIRVVAVHMAWHLANASMARRLRDHALAAREPGEALLLLGDFNTWPDRDAFDVLAAPPLRDARPGAPPTHFGGLRLDFLFLDGLSVSRGLDRRRSYEELRPVSRLWLPDACDHPGSTECPLSDHLPEGAVLRF